MVTSVPPQRQFPEGISCGIVVAKNAGLRVRIATSKPSSCSFLWNELPTIFVENLAPFVARLSWENKFYFLRKDWRGGDVFGCKKTGSDSGR
jgi:hypothetical protein